MSFEVNKISGSGFVITKGELLSKQPYNLYNPRVIMFYSDVK